LDKRPSLRLLVEYRTIGRMKMPRPWSLHWKRRRLRCPRRIGRGP